MQLYRFREEARFSRVFQGVTLAVAVTGVLTFCFVVLLRDCHLLSGYWWLMSVALYGGLLGKSLEKIMHWTGLRGPKVANFLALVSLGVASLLIYWLWIQQIGYCLLYLGAISLVAYLCFYNFRWQKHGYCEGCGRWLEPVAYFGPYRYNKRIITLLQRQEVSFLEQAGGKDWKFLELALANCPGCGECSTLRVVKVEHHLMGVGRQVLGLLSVPADQQVFEIGPSPCPG